MKRIPVGSVWLIVGLLLLLGWNTTIGNVVLYPVKLLVVFLHELSHALAALATGGSVKEITLNENLGGETVTMGGSRFITLTAGYLGSLLWGCGIMMLAVRSKTDRILTGVLGVVLISTTLLFIRNGFGLAFGLASGAAMLICSRFLSHRWNDLLLRFIGFTSAIYAVLDVKSDILDRPELRSDARMLAEEFGGFTLMWGGVWFLLALFTTYKCLRWCARHEQQNEQEPKLAGPA